MLQLRPHHRHLYSETELTLSRPVSHVRLVISPDGGVSRLRLWGQPTPVTAAPANQQRPASKLWPSRHSSSIAEHQTQGWFKVSDACVPVFHKAVRHLHQHNTSHNPLSWQHHCNVQVHSHSPLRVQREIFKTQTEQKSSKWRVFWLKWSITKMFVC